MATIKLIVGLGNPGLDYQMTRHNAGFWFVDALAEKYGKSFCLEQKFQALLCRYQKNDIDCRLCKPQTYMNNSGLAVQAIIHFYKLSVENVLVVHDEIDLAAGIARLKQGGGHGGHNGLRDIINHIGSADFLRLRIGVGHPGSPDQVTPYVLARPSIADEQQIMDRIAFVLAKEEHFFQDNLNKLMTELNNKNNGAIA